jgi:hypothetical protein
MEQRPLRLGDLVDDYCPRERRITNHAIVAIVKDAIRQTRCMTCDAEHVYKAGKAPRRRKTDSTAALYEEVLANAGGQLVTPGDSDDANELNAAEPSPQGAEPSPPAQVAAEAVVNDGDDPERPDTRSDDERWSAHRPLIRATLPRTENDQPPPRPIPEFTMHQRHGRGAHGFRQGPGWYDRSGGQGRNGSRGNGRSLQGPGNGQPRGQGRLDDGGRPRRHGKKRSR